MSFTRTATARFQVKSWRETLVEDIDGQGTSANGTYYPSRGYTRVETEYTYDGALQGTSHGISLIAYKADAAPVLGFERFEGSIDGIDGTCVLQHIGSQDQSSVRDRLVVVPGMGTGGLETLRGEADLIIGGHSDDGYALTLRYDLG